MPNCRLAILSLLLLSLITVSARAQLSRDIWGMRIGVLGVPAYSGAHPLIQPFYETPTSDVDPISLMFDVTLAYTDFATLGSAMQLVDYGFHGGVRYGLTREGSLRYFTSLLLGADVFPDPVAPDPGRVCIAIPLTFGATDDISRVTQLEFGLTARPSWYYRQSWDFSYALTVGARFLAY